MSNIKEQKVRRLKRTVAGGSLAGTFLVSLIVILSFVTMLSGFLVYMMDSKLRDEFEDVSRRAELYEMTSGSENMAAQSLLNAPDSDYLILDSDGSVLTVQGSNTCDMSGGGRIEVLGIENRARQLPSNLQLPENRQLARNVQMELEADPASACWSIRIRKTGWCGPEAMARCISTGSRSGIA